MISVAVSLPFHALCTTLTPKAGPPHTCPQHHESTRKLFASASYEAKTVICLTAHSIKGVTGRLCMGACLVAAALIDGVALQCLLGAARTSGVWILDQRLQCALGVSEIQQDSTL